MTMAATAYGGIGRGRGATVEDTDETIARSLRDLPGELHITEQELEAWLYQEGLTPRLPGFAVNVALGCSTRTIRRWAARVRILIGLRREDLAAGRVRFGVSIAQGSRVRWAADGTPVGRLPGSSWDAERIKRDAKRRAR